MSQIFDDLFLKSNTQASNLIKNIKLFDASISTCTPQQFDLFILNNLESNFFTKITSIFTKNFNYYDYFVFTCFCNAAEKGNENLIKYLFSNKKYSSLILNSFGFEKRKHYKVFIDDKFEYCFFHPYLAAYKSLYSNNSTIILNFIKNNYFVMDNTILLNQSFEFLNKLPDDYFLNLYNVLINNLDHKSFQLIESLRFYAISKNDINKYNKLYKITYRKNDPESKKIFEYILNYKNLDIFKHELFNNNLYVLKDDIIEYLNSYSFSQEYKKNIHNSFLNYELNLKLKQQNNLNICLDKSNKLKI